MKPYLLLLLSLVFPAVTMAVFTGSDTVSWKTGTLNGRSIFRTNFAIYEGPNWPGVAKTLSAGLYDPISNKTFLAYDGGLRSDGIHSATDPIVTSFDHSSHTWEKAIKLASTEKGNLGGDDHNYSQILMDKQGFIHVFHTMHNSFINMLHAVSKSPRDIGTSANDWNVVDIPGTCHNTYGAAFTDNQGEMYVFYRSGESGGPGQFYEPETYVKSTDDGKTWSSSIIAIDPGRPENHTECAKNPDGSYIRHTCQEGQQFCAPTSIVHPLPENGGTPSTIYTNMFVQDKVRNGVWIPFNEYYGRGANADPQPLLPKRMVFFDFDTDHFISADGRDWGSLLDYNEFAVDNCCNLGPHNYNSGNANIPVIENQTHRIPTVYFTRPIGSEKYIYQVNWNPTTKSWDETDISSYFGPVERMVTGEYRPEYGTDLYVSSKSDSNPPFNLCQPPVDPSLNYSYHLMLYNNQGGWNGVRLFSTNEVDPLGNIADNSNWEVVRTNPFSLIQDANPELKGYFTSFHLSCERPTSWDAGFWNVFPVGNYYAFGEERLNPNLVYDDFEWDTSAWKSNRSENISISKDQAHTGEKSLKIVHDGANYSSNAYKTFPSPLVGEISVWMYDNMSTTASFQASLGITNNPEANSETERLRVGYIPTTSTNNYSYCTTFDISGCIDTGIHRSLGWHKFTGVVTPDGSYGFIDNQDLSNLGINSSLTGAQRVNLVIGSNTPTEAFYFDDFSIKDLSSVHRPGDLNFDNHVNLEDLQLARDSKNIFIYSLVVKNYGK